MIQRFRNLPEKEDFFSRSLLITTASTFRSLNTNQHALIIIPTFEEYTILHQAVASGHFIIMPFGTDSSPDEGAVLGLPRVDRKGVVEVLKETGLSESEAKRFSKESNRTIPILRRLLEFEKYTPEWVQEEHVRSVIPALLAGKRDDKKEGTPNSTSQTG